MTLVDNETGLGKIYNQFPLCNIGHTILQPFLLIGLVPDDVETIYQNLELVDCMGYFNVVILVMI